MWLFRCGQIATPTIFHDKLDGPELRTAAGHGYLENHMCSILCLKCPAFPRWLDGIKGLAPYLSGKVRCEKQKKVSFVGFKSTALEGAVEPMASAAPLSLHWYVAYVSAQDDTLHFHLCGMCVARSADQHL